MKYESEKVRSLEMNVEEIREPKNGLIRMSNDEKQREIYEMRSKILKDKVSALNKAKKEGIEQGLQQGLQKGLEQGKKQEKIEIAKNLLDILDDETIAAKTGLEIKEIQNLRVKDE